MLFMTIITLFFCFSYPHSEIWGVVGGGKAVFKREWVQTKEQTILKRRGDCLDPSSFPVGICFY